MKNPLAITVIYLLGVLHISAGVNTLNEQMISQKEDLPNRIDSLVAIHIDENHPGGAIGILSGTEPLFSKSYGIMDLEQKVNLNENSVFNIASVSKQFTAFAILMLESEGKLDLDDNIRRWLPDLPAYDYEITIRHLLQHTSGIASTDLLRLFAGLSFDEQWTHKDEYNLIKSYPQLNFTPGESHVYSNGGYSLLAQIVEQAGGMNFSAFMEEKVFHPLGMTRTFVLDDPAKPLVNVAKGYTKEGDDFVRVSSDEDYSYGAGNIYSTMADMIKWGQNLLSAEAKNKTLLNRISNPYNTLSNGDTIGYTYGFYVRTHKGIKMVEHSGGVPGFRNQFMIFPDHGLLVILMFNNEISTRRLATDIVELLLADNLKEEIPKPQVAIDYDPELLRTFEGSFQMPDGMELTFNFEQDTFWLILPGDHKFQLFAESETRFFLKAFNAQCTFVISDGGDVNEMIWHQGGGDHKSLRVEDRVELTAGELAGYAGEYAHQELNAMYPIAFADGKLTLQPPYTFKKYLGFDSVELNHLNGDRFATDNLGMLEFTRDDSGQLTGFVLASVGRLQNVRFIRL
jgi:CubicO group peptidase (beta-lactamase class C family)